MINLEKEYPDRLYFSIKEVAKFLAISPSTLRYWGKEFNELNPRKNGKGDRLYTKDDIQLVRTIHNLVKEKGYTIGGAKRKIAQRSNAVPSKFELIERLEHIQYFLKELRKNI